jgi:glutaredoxin
MKTNMKKYFGLLALSLIAYGAQAEEYYRSLDGTGKVHYGDEPLTDAADINKIKPLSTPDPGDNTPYSIRRAQEKFPVTLYVGDGCGNACAMAQDYLNKRGIPYTEKKLTTIEEIEAFKKASGGDQIPVMNIGNNWLKGFLESSWSAELDAAGYPKFAPYGYRPVKKSAPEAENNKSE